MTRVDFYVLAGAAAGGVHRLACRIADKAYRLEHRVFIHTASDAEARRIDELLWTFSDGSFVPHALAGSLDEKHKLARHPVLIGGGEAPAAAFDLLINLAADVPAFATQFERVAEVVDADEKRRELSRERYRHYRGLGLNIETHKISG